MKTLEIYLKYTKQSFGYEMITLGATGSFASIKRSSDSQRESSSK
ncbi:hypothetical protein [Helicobacter sp. 11S02596-1]|nr:hypothetical protein [Helicobacter sp. 11S02596-1]